jgi:thymidine kinase
MAALHLILGPMFSGKTTRLIELSSQYKNPAIINYALDTRYHTTMLSTHDKKMVPCIQALQLADVIPFVQEADAIFINEGQFFPDLIDIVKTLVETCQKEVYVCGLDSDFRREPFGDILRLITLCDSVEKLKARCVRCQNHAIFTHRVSNEVEQDVIGSDEYIPLCRECFLR